MRFCVINTALLISAVLVLPNVAQSAGSSEATTSASAANSSGTQGTTSEIPLGAPSAMTPAIPSGKGGVTGGVTGSVGGGRGRGGGGGGKK
jgi:hypothetical protein